MDIGTLLFKIDEDGTVSLVLRAPKVKLLTKPPLEIEPAIGLSRDKRGRYHLLAGSGDQLVDPVHVGEDLRKLFDSPPGGPKAAMQLPTCRQLKNEKGGFKTYDEYDLNRRLFHDDMPVGSVWPELTPQLYDALVKSYQKTAADDCK